jgi:hypothetical protein
MMDQVAAVVVILLLILVVGLGGGLALALRAHRKGLTQPGTDPAIDPFRVGEPWRTLVRTAQRAQSRYHDLVASSRPGPTRERLGDIGARVDEAVRECWRIAQRGHELRSVLSGMNIAATRTQLDAVGTDPELADRAASLQARVESYDRVARGGTDTENQLRLLVARLEETAARGAELSLVASEDPALAQLGTDVTEVADELEALRQAFEETARPTANGSLGTLGGLPTDGGLAGRAMSGPALGLPADGTIADLPGYGTVAPNPQSEPVPAEPPTSELPPPRPPTG